MRRWVSLLKGFLNPRQKFRRGDFFFLIKNNFFTKNRLQKGIPSEGILKAKEAVQNLFRFIGGRVRKKLYFNGVELPVRFQPSLKNRLPLFRNGKNAKN